MENEMQAAKTKTVGRDRIVEAFVAYAAEKGLTFKPDQARFASDALEEMPEVVPGLLMNWYMANQYRYAKMRELDRRAIRTAVFNFLLDFSRGKVAL